jgi:hypothetical protein
MKHILILLVIIIFASCTKKWPEYRCVCTTNGTITADTYVKSSWGVQGAQEACFHLKGVEYAADSSCLIK